MIRNLNANVKHIAMLVTKASEVGWSPASKLTLESYDKKALMPLTYIEKIPGKCCLKIYRACNHWLNVPEEKYQSIEDIMHISGNAAFLLDDIEDGATSRYGVPAAHRVHSHALTLNAASHAFALALQKVLQLGHPLAVGVYSDTLLEAHRGQGIEIYWRDCLQCPTEDEYIDMVKQKTAVFFTSAFQLLQLFSERKVDGMKLLSLLGVYYQVRDDYCNLFNQKGLKSLAEMDITEVVENKDYCTDLTEGKFTLPIIYALKHPDRGNEVLHILKQRTNDPILKKHCISILEELGSIQYTREVLEALETSIYSEMERLGDNPLMATIMAGLSNWRQVSDDDDL